MEKRVSGALGVTVAICTWNRAASLAETLSSLCHLRIPPAVTWECLVVNNNSTDATDAVIASFADRLPIRRALEPKQGLSAARNTAVAHAGGDLILWLDDDVRVSEGWLEGYIRAAERWPRAAYFGGPTEPRYTSDPPRWVVANPRILDGPFGLQDLGGQEGLFPAGEAPYGDNMAVRRRAFREQAFDERLGVCGGERRIGEETALFDRLTQQGEHGVWVPAARVFHTIRAGRLTPDFLRRHFVAFGQYAVRHGDARRPPVLRVPRMILSVGCRLGRASAAGLRALGLTAWVPLFARCSIIEGMLAATAEDDVRA